MMKSLLQTLNKIFEWFGFLDNNRRLSITNTAVIIFISICAIRMLFVGVKIQTAYFMWDIQAVDMESTLPLLFSLINYGHKRIENNKKGDEVEKKDSENESK